MVALFYLPCVYLLYLFGGLEAMYEDSSNGFIICVLEHLFPTARNQRNETLISITGQKPGAASLTVCEKPRESAQQSLNPAL